MRAPTVGLFPPEALERQPLLADLLTALGLVRVVPGRDDGTERYHATITLTGSLTDGLSHARWGRRSLVFASGSTADALHSAVGFSHSEHLPTCFRGATLDGMRLVSVLRADAHDEVLATAGDQPAWLRRHGPEGTVDLVAVPAPAISAGPSAADGLMHDQGLALIALIHFVREISGWVQAPYRACFMFDDPNLHWPTYGYVDYAAIARAASERRYHVAFATVPLDGWFVHGPTAALFRTQARHLSLLVHGNNHTHCELHSTLGSARQRALAEQSASRMDALSVATGVPIARVMAAPHGACSLDMAAALRRAGFEGATISRGSLTSRNPHVPWPAILGLQPTDWFGGLAVMPRFGLRALSDREIRTALFLGQPVIPMGHHQDLRDGVGILNGIAARINTIGAVSWMNLTDVARSSFSVFQQGTSLHIRLHSRHIDFHVPNDVSAIAFSYPTEAHEAGTRLIVRTGTDQECPTSLPPGEPLPVKAGLRLRVEIVGQCGTSENSSAPSHRTPLAALLRRHACEARDRLQPTLHRLAAPRLRLHRT